MDATAGFSLNVRVKTGARVEGICGRVGERYKVAVREAPEKGRANKRLCEVLAAFFDVPAGSVAVRSGHAHRDKCVSVCGIDAESALARLASEV